MVWDLEAARITSLPDDAFYIPEFITEEEEQILLQKVIPPQSPRSLLLSGLQSTIHELPQNPQIETRSRIIYILPALHQQPSYLHHHEHPLTCYTNSYTPTRYHPHPSPAGPI